MYYPSHKQRGPHNMVRAAKSVVLSALLRDSVVFAAFIMEAQRLAVLVGIVGTLEHRSAAFLLIANELHALPIVHGDDHFARDRTLVFAENSLAGDSGC